MENYLLSEIERRYSVVRCVRFVVGGAGWSACPAGGRKWKVNDAKTGNEILWIVGNRLPVPLLARARTSRARKATHHVTPPTEKLPSCGMLLLPAWWVSLQPLRSDDARPPCLNGSMPITTVVTATRK